MPAVVLSSTDGRAFTFTFSETFIEAVTITYTGTDARTDDGDARAHTTTVRKSDARALVTTDNRSALLGTDASALLLITVLERQDYGCY